MAAVEGADVTAVHDGVVAYADAFTGFGRLVIVDHGGQTFSLYGNLKDVIVREGARVTRGDRVRHRGRLGHGRGPGCTLSFASTVARWIPYNGSRVDSHNVITHRRIVLWISLPVVAFAVIGGFLSRATAR